MNFSLKKAVRSFGLAGLVALSACQVVTTPENIKKDVGHMLNGDYSGPFEYKYGDYEGQYSKLKIRSSDKTIVDHWPADRSLVEGRNDSNSSSKRSFSLVEEKPTQGLNLLLGVDKNGNGSIEYNELSFATGMPIGEYKIGQNVTGLINRSVISGTKKINWILEGESGQNLMDLPMDLSTTQFNNSNEGLMCTINLRQDVFTPDSKYIFKVYTDGKLYDSKTITIRR